MTTGPTLHRPHGVSRIFFQEILEGDRRKLEARSNDATTGGGARDLRVPHANFGQLFRSMFPSDRVESRVRSGVRQDVTLYEGRLYWLDASGTEQSVEVLYEPPTSARPSEGRIARIHDLPPLAERVPSADEGHTFLLLVQTDDGKVYPHYITQATLRDPNFNREIAAAIRSCMSSTAANHSVRGFVDYVIPQTYCHG